MWIHIGLTLRPPYSTGNRSPLATVQTNTLTERRFGHSDIRTGNWTPAIQRLASQSLDSIYCRHGSLISLFSATQCFGWFLSNKHRGKATEALCWPLIFIYPRCIASVKVLISFLLISLRLRTCSQTQLYVQFLISGRAVVFVVCNSVCILLKVRLPVALML